MRGERELTVLSESVLKRSGGANRSRLSSAQSKQSVEPSRQYWPALQLQAGAPPLPPVPPLSAPLREFPAAVRDAEFFAHRQNYQAGVFDGGTT